MKSRTNYQKAMAHTFIYKEHLRFRNRSFVPPEIFQQVLFPPFREETWWMALREIGGEVLDSMTTVSGEKDLFDKRCAPYTLCKSCLTSHCWQVWQKSCIGAQKWSFSELWWLKVHFPKTNILEGAKPPPVQHLFWLHPLFLFVFFWCFDGYRVPFVPFHSGKCTAQSVFTLRL